MSRENVEKLRILVVDDREEDREILTAILADKYNSCMAVSGEECMRAVLENRPDLILLDINMPGGIDGIETLRRIRKEDHGLPIIIITGVGTHDKIIESYQLGANDFIVKPYDVFNIRERIEKVLLEQKKEQNEEQKKGASPQDEKFFKKEYLNMIQALSELIELKNPFTHRHSQKVTKYAVAIAEELGLSYEEVEQIKQAGLIHDIGKVGIRDSILNKPGSLTDEEFEEIKKHPAMGVKVLQHLRLLQLEMVIVAHHHERWDGNGYPAGLKGNKIPRASRILAVADSSDAMLSNRAYRSAQSLKQTISELVRCSGTQFDSEVVKAFLSVLEKKPDIIEVDQKPKPV